MMFTPVAVFRPAPIGASPRRVVVVAALLMAVTAGAARADSDGYYCVGPDYLAYQLRAGISTTGVGSHILRVVRFGGGRIVLFGEVAMEDFQPHRLVCEQGLVRIGGISSRPVEYVVNVTGRSGPAVVQVITDPQRALQRTELRNLGGWAPNGMVRLPSSDPSHEYRLVTTETEERSGDELLHHKKTDLVMTDENGNVLQRIELFDGHLVETID